MLRNFGIQLTPVYRDKGSKVSGIRGSKWDTTDPRAAKDIGSKVSGLRGSKWDDDKYGIMLELLTYKFTDHPELKMALLKTDNKILVESGRDTHYAIGLPITSRDIYNETKWSGKNKLGEMLCQVRGSIRDL